MARAAAFEALKSAASRRAPHAACTTSAWPTTGCNHNHAAYRAEAHRLRQRAIKTAVLAAFGASRRRSTS